MDILTLIKNLIENRWDCSLTHSIAKGIGEKLSVPLGQDAQGRSRTLEITVFDQSFPDTQTNYYRIQFTVLFPYKVQVMALNQTASLILFLDQMMPYPGLELNELNNQLLYRYVWLTKKSVIEKPIILGIIGIIAMTLNTYANMIEEVAQGRLTFDQILQQIIGYDKDS